jgi:hypothetical protein
MDLESKKPFTERLFLKIYQIKYFTKAFLQSFFLKSNFGYKKAL